MFVSGLFSCPYFFSAGVGRTGTFISLDALYRQGLKEGKINIVEYVNTMREDRMNMIQNAVSFLIGTAFLFLLYVVVHNHGNMLLFVYSVI